MYLKQIKAVGFKSFAEKMVIDLTDGISGVVGPNGSGKSNIVDAVRWVLGEQSVKELRGTGFMSDVIFSGSKSRKASSSASVTLVFDNTDRYIPTDYSEVAIKRCIYKTGENEYFLNNEKCRLKDILELFSDSGVSKESYNIISQGDIASILSNKPEERRIIFEAAAGTLKYKRRKDEALRKLERTHDNMRRVNDITLELEENIKPLREQKEAALRYQENKKKLDKIEVSLIVKEVDELNYEYQDNKRKISELNIELENIEKNNNIDNSKTQELKLEQTKKNEELFQMSQNLAKISSETEKLSGKKNLITERQKYNSTDTKVHDNLIRLKEDIMKKENEFLLNKNNIEILKNKYNDTKEKFDAISNEYNYYLKEHDKRENELLNSNRLENEVKYKIKMLEDAIDNNSSLPYAVKNILDNPKLVGIHGVISSLIENEEEYDIAISTALGAASSFVVVDDEIIAKEAINYLKINKFGRVTFFPLNIIKSKEIDNITYQILQSEQGFIDVASNLVRYTSIYNNIIKNQLGNVIIVKDINSANCIAKKINYRYKIVTLDGEILHVGGSLTGGINKNSSTVISQKHELEENRRKLNVIYKNKSNLESIINELDNKFQNLLLVRNKILDEKTKTESMLSIEITRNKTLKTELEDLKYEHDNLNSVINNTLSIEEEKIINEYYQKEKEKNELISKINILKENINNIFDEIKTKEKEYKINNTLFYTKSKELKELEIKVNRSDVKIDSLLSTLTNEYSITFEKAKANYFLEIDIEEARKIVDKCKFEIKKIGDVNIGAIEEYDRVSKRLDFLNNQKNDLEKAEETILQIIKELDSIMKEKFINSFDVIKVKFKEIFKKLFGGGDAELKLTDPDDILSTGIDIKALPPGKTLKHISLLSGGEKTLTAVSLLFSILEARPVPFCILDEVEAALDEVNVDNFGKFLNEFKKKTQFIVITHKKKTMEYADCLYGITMQESGVSKLVSVKLEDIKESSK